MGDISRSANKVLRVVDNLKSETGRLIDTFESLLQVMKMYQLKHNVANATAATTGLIGGVLCFTPLFPLGAGMVGAATGIAVVTDIVDSVEYREFKEKLEKELSSYNSMVAHLVRISETTLPSEVGIGFRENGITEDSLKISTTLGPRMTIIENLIKALDDKLWLGGGFGGIASLLTALKVGHGILNGMTAAAMKFLFGYVGIIVGLALVVHAYQSFKNDHPTVEKCKSILKILSDAKYKFDEFELCLNEIMRGDYVIHRGLA